MRAATGPSTAAGAAVAEAAASSDVSNQSGSGRMAFPRGVGTERA